MSYLILRRDFELYSYLSGKLVLTDGRNSFSVDGNSPALAEALACLKAGTDRAHLVSLLGPDGCQALIAELNHRDLVTEENENPFKGTRYERQLGFFKGFVGQDLHAQRELRRKSVALVGIGGIGCVVAQHLMAAGVARLIVIDFDTVTEQDLNRQFCFYPHDVGKSKVTAFVEFAKRFAPNVEVHVAEARILNVADFVLPLMEMEFR